MLDKNPISGRLWWGADKRKALGTWNDRHVLWSERQRKPTKPYNESCAFYCMKIRLEYKLCMKCPSFLSLVPVLFCGGRGSESFRVRKACFRAHKIGLALKNRACVVHTLEPTDKAGCGSLASTWPRLENVLGVIINIGKEAWPYPSLRAHCTPPPPNFPHISQPTHDFHSCLPRHCAPFWGLSLGTVHPHPNTHVNISSFLTTIQFIVHFHETDGVHTFSSTYWAFIPDFYSFFSEHFLIFFSVICLFWVTTF